MERAFEVGLPLRVVHARWHEFYEKSGGGMSVRLSPAGGSSTRVCLEGAGEGLEDAARHFERFLEENG